MNGVALVLLTSPGNSGAIASQLPGGHMFWIGAAAGLGFGLLPFIPWWVKITMLLLAIVGSGFVHYSHGHISPGIVPWAVVIAISLGFGLHYGRVRGLRHLGEYELANRRSFIRTRSRF